MFTTKISLTYSIFLAALVIAAISVVVFGRTAHAAPVCSDTYHSGISVPTGYGAAFNVFSSAHEQLVKTSACADAAISVTVGNGTDASLAYKKGYVWNGSEWTIFDLKGTGSLVGDAYYTGQATGVMSIPTGNQIRYYVGYSCVLNDSAWQCGCRDASCTTHNWQVQRVSKTVGGTGGVSVTFIAAPSSIAYGISSLLIWSATGATSCTSDDFSTSGKTSGSVSVAPTRTTTYSITCTGSGGSVSKSVTVTVKDGGGSGPVCGNAICEVGETASSCSVDCGDGGGGGSEDGDRMIPAPRVYPPSMLLENGGRVIDVTKEPFNAKGDGKTDDTAAIIKAFDYVMSFLKRYPRDVPDTNFIMYFPTGTYKISNTIQYTGTATEGEDVQNIRFIGQDRRNTTIKLADDSTGFGVGSKKPMINVTKGELNALETKNTIRGLTVDTGSGNPGAIAVRFSGANGNEMGDLTIKSGDGSGEVGLFMVGISQFYMHDITIEGFKVGLGVDYYRATGLALEHMTFRNQSVAGIRVGESALTARKVLSINSVPAVMLVEPAAYGAIVESTFQGGSSGNAAIQIGEGYLFARDITTSGYGSAIKRSGSVAAAGPNISEYTSSPMRSLFGASGSIRLPVEEVPTVAWPDEDDWAVITSNDTAVVQAAFNSGKPGIMFKGFKQSFDKVTVPPSVKRINLAFSTVNGTLRIEDPSSEPLLIEEGYTNGTLVQQVANRPVMFTAMAGHLYNNINPDPSDKLFMTAVSGMGIFTLGNQKIWGRMMNTEPKGAEADKIDGAFTWNGSTAWMLSFKTEVPAPAHWVRNGKLEILGGMANQTAFRSHGEHADPDDPIVRVENSQVSATLVTSGWCDDIGYKWGIRNTKGGVMKAIPWSDLLTRPGCTHQAFMPLYADTAP